MKEQALKLLKESALECSFCTGLICDTQENLEARREQRAHGQSRARTDVCLGGRVREEQRGSPCLPLLLCAGCFASRPFTRSSFCAYSCFISQWLLELSVPFGTWGQNDFPTSAPLLFASSPNMAICKMYLLTSLLIFVLSLNSGFTELY